jgi:hypothetical protein
MNSCPTYRTKQTLTTLMKLGCNLVEVSLARSSRYLQQILYPTSYVTILNFIFLNSEICKTMFRRIKCKFSSRQAYMPGGGDELV